MYLHPQSAVTRLGALDEGQKILPIEGVKDPRTLEPRPLKAKSTLVEGTPKMTEARLNSGPPTYLLIFVDQSSFHNPAFQLFHLSVSLHFFLIFFFFFSFPLCLISP